MTTKPQSPLRPFRTLAGLAAAGVVAAGVRNVYRFRVREVRRVLPRLRRPLHVVQMSDLHYGLWLRAGSVRRWVAAARALDPDLIVLTGDVVQGRRPIDVRPLRRLLAPLRAPLGTWACWGNHDHAWAGDGPQELEEVLAGAGVRVLTNEGVRLREDLWLAGVDDHGAGLPDVPAALAGAPAEAAIVLLAHRPGTLAEVPPDVDLVLSGHTHGGQLRPPVLGDGIPYGWWSERPPTWVSSGLGVGLLPLRAGIEAELVSLRLEPGPPPGGPTRRR